jgi:putative ABC transport system substrate-binding protein
MKRREFVIVLSGAVLSPVVPGAQQPTMPVIGFLSSRSPDESKHLLAAFLKGLGEVGFVEGTNIVVEYRWALGEYEKLPELAADLVKRRVAWSEVMFPPELHCRLHQQFQSYFRPVRIR